MILAGCSAVMLRVNSNQSLAAIEAALVHAAQRRGINVLSIAHLNRLFQLSGNALSKDAISLTVCRPDLSAALLEADIRFANFIPCRLTVIQEDGGVILESLTAAEICRLIGRPELEAAALPLENMLRELLEEAARAGRPGRPDAPAPAYEPGATEGMVSPRATIPQRIDCFGSKVEDLAGTGQHDAPGG